MQWMSQTLDALLGLFSTHPALAVALCFLVAFGEALLLIGLFVPSTTVLVGAGTLVGLGQLGFAPVFWATVAGAVAGDALGFWIGRRYNQRLRGIWPFSRYPGVIEQGEAYFARHGGKSIFIVRFIPGAKAVVPAIAAMAGMPPFRFTMINVASAIAWSSAHLLPAILLGRGIRVAQVANPRLAILMALVAAALALAWAATRFAQGVLMPRADRGRMWLIDRCDRSANPVLRRAGDVLANRDGLFVGPALAVMALALLAGFAALVAGYLFEPEVARSDAAISAFVQTLRSDTGTRWMVTITMLGDGAVLIPLAIAMVGALLLRRQWGMAGVIAVASAAVAAVIPLIKVLLHRDRPIPLYDGSGAFSFPSGHSTQSTVIYGLFALLLVRAVPRRWRRPIYLATVILVSLVAFSRVYLLAHWPSDVVAGLLFGGGVILLTALALHGRGLRVRGTDFALILGTFALVWAPSHLVMGYATARAFYAVEPPAPVLAAEDWLAEGWVRLPAARILLDGTWGEPMLIQTDLAQAEIAAALTAAGWQPSTASRLDAMVAAVLPLPGGMAAHPPLPLTHSGRPPLATFLRPVPGDPSAREALRLWDAGVRVPHPDGERPLILISAERERLEPVALGLELIEPVADAAPPDPATLAAELPGTPRQAGGTVLLPAP